jgi:hypothetical protein
MKLKLLLTLLLVVFPASAENKENEEEEDEFTPKTLLLCPFIFDKNEHELKPTNSNTSNPLNQDCERFREYLNSNLEDLVPWAPLPNLIFQQAGKNNALFIITDDDQHFWAATLIPYHHKTSMWKRFQLRRKILATGWNITDCVCSDLSDEKKTACIENIMKSFEK